MVAPKLIAAGNWTEITRLTADAVAVAKECA
jgi:2-keto-3-deoxy-6-phosphogluconate aldolase